MKIQINKKILAYALASTISLCTLPVNAYSENTIVTTNNKDKDLFKEIKSYYTLTALENIEVFDAPSSNTNIVDTLEKGKTVRMAANLNDEFFCIEYEEDVYGYIKVTDKVKINIDFYIPAPIKMNGYIKEETELYNEKEFVLVPQYEYCEIIQSFEDDYLVKTGNYVGYINKNFIELINENVVVVDISDQKVKYYENNEVVFESDVVTGKPSTPTHTGYFEIKGKRHNTVLRGPGYASPVNDFAPFDNGIGFHDAKWRDESEFGGETYLTKGSHGCVNMPVDQAPELINRLEVGSKVLVKE